MKPRQKKCIYMHCGTGESVSEGRNALCTLHEIRGMCMINKRSKGAGKVAS
jgi:hypothetical protein